MIFSNCTLELYFPKTHIYKSIFSGNKVKVSFSSKLKHATYEENLINRNMKALKNSAEIEESWNCINKNYYCLLDEKCLNPNIYEAQIMSNQPNYRDKIYTGTAEKSFKQRFNKHTKSANFETLWKWHWQKYWTIKHYHFTPKVI